MNANQLLVRDNLDRISSRIIQSAINVHKEMGPGLLESVYQYCLVEELISNGLHVDSEFSVPLHYRGKLLGKEFVIDMLIDGEVIVELKAIEGILPVHEAQIISYLKITNKKLGLLINFNVPWLKAGIRRFVNNF